MAAPEELTPPLAWESGEGSFASRFLQTIGTALSPSRSAPAFAFGGVSRAVLFFMLTFVPLALARGVIPYTQLVRFGPTFAVTVAQGATSSRIALDVVRGAGIALIESVAVFIALFVCFRSLAGSFGRPGSTGVATRFALYRAFLLPLGAFMPFQTADGVGLLPDGLLLSLGLWFVPARVELALVIALLVAVVPAVLVFTSMRNVARLVIGAEPVASFLIAFVPWVLSVLVFGLTHAAIDSLIPPITFQ